MPLEASRGVAASLSYFISYYALQVDEVFSIGLKKCEFTFQAMHNKMAKKYGVVNT